MLFAKRDITEADTAEDERGKSSGDKRAELVQHIELKSGQKIDKRKDDSLSGSRNAE